MRVLFITRKYPPQKGGMENYSYLLTTYYEGDKKIISLGKSQKHLVWFLPYCILYTLLTLRKWDVIEIGDGLMCSVGKIAKWFSKRVKVVVTVHGLDMTFPNKLYQWYFRHFSRGLDLYVPNSVNTEKIAREHQLSPTVVVPPATIEATRFQNLTPDRAAFCEKYGLPADAVLLCTTGRLVKRKGVAWFVEHVLPKLSDCNYRYLVAGGGKCEGDIRAAIDRAGVGDRVLLLGRVSDEDLDELYVNSDLFLAPNIAVPGDVEGFGMVAVEAAYARCVVVASDMEGLHDAVCDNVSGYLLPSQNADAYAAKLRELFARRDEADAFTAGAKDYVLNHFTGQAVAARYHALFQDLLQA